MNGYKHIFSPIERLWTVGYYTPAGEWHAVSDHESEEEAGARVERLNGCPPEHTRSDLTTLAKALDAALIEQHQLDVATILCLSNDLREQNQRYRLICEAAQAAVLAYKACGVYGSAQRGTAEDTKRWLIALQDLRAVLGLT